MSQPDGTLVFLQVALLVSFVTSAILLVKYPRRGPSVLPYEPRGHIPWAAAEVLPFLLLWAMFFAPFPGRTTHQDVEKPRGSEHPMVTLIQKCHEPPILAVTVLSGVVVGPIAEEFLFRLLLQGWLEAGENRLRRRLRGLRRVVRGVLPVVVVSAIFATAHWRSGGTIDPNKLLGNLLLTSLLDLIIVGLAAGWLLQRGTTLKDLGVVPGKFAADVRTGLVAFLAIGGPVYLLRVGAALAFGENSRLVDPITLFPFALVLGVLYYRTHRLVPSVVLHMSLNATSLLMAWLAYAQ